MRLRRDTVPALQAAIHETQKRAEHEDEARRKSEALAAEAEAERPSVADDPDAFAAASERARRHREEVERLELLAERIASDRADLERRLAVARYEDARAGLKSALTRQHEASAKVASATTTLGRSCAALTAARDEVDSALKAAIEVCPPDLDFESPGPDEPAWPDVGRVIEVLAVGPRQPFAKRMAAIHRHTSEREHAARARLVPAVTEALELASYDRLEHTPPEFLPDALALAEREVAARRARVPNSQTGREIVVALERRLERIRVLVAEAEKAEAADGAVAV